VSRRHHDAAWEPEPLVPTPEPPPIIKQVITGAALVRQGAAAADRDPHFARKDQREGQAMIDKANEKLPELTTGAGGELALDWIKTTAWTPEDYLARDLCDTVKDPTYVAANATYERLRQAESAGCLPTALDVADTIKARNSLERMLAHQLAAAHNVAMNFAGVAMQHLFTAKNAANLDRRAALTVEAARLAGAADRMMARFQEGMMTLARSRSGGRQSVVVQHVHINATRAMVASKISRKTVVRTPLQGPQGDGARKRRIGKTPVRGAG
jgi:hypothetical protein